ncbi:CRISPR-associated protein Csh1 [Thermosyntropha lipolytica DSM 11003]|uniref:CRISPR-associated protein Csh1 n=1 Tax=Thermosyntropha lipolytica DSM 11003 TaxID=1123382 RepID=A0A1M5KA89_9FIRM|nr:TIGR02556 family CRISPR-associated protein [Thermosyntropha lipolytica]SHG49766.1 CRISPR-associated protein Csh1 [Thermosyntropha lipolytica DSM 11003]
MLESIIELGGKVLSQKEGLDALIQEVPLESRKGEKKHVCKIIFDTRNKIFDVDVNEEIDENTVKKYLHVGSADGSNSPQWYITSKGSSYILSELFPNLKEQGLFADIVDDILTNFYWKSEESLGHRKYNYMLDIKKLGISEKTMEALKQEALKENKPGKKLLDLVGKEFEKWIADKKGCKKDDIGLYTVIVNDLVLVEDKDYQAKVLESKKPKGAAGGKKKGSKSSKSEQNLQCNVCGSFQNISSDLNKMKIKYFTTNQEIFKGSLKSYEKSLNLCSSCIEKLQAGEIFVQQNLGVNIAGFDVLVIPNLIYGSGVEYEEMKNLTREIINTVNMSKSIDALTDFRQQLDLLKEFDDIIYLLDFVFIRRSNAATKILRLIKDVKPSFFELLEKAVDELKEMAARHISIYNYRGGLNSVYYLTPVRFKSGDNSSFRDLLALYDALFLGRQVDEKHIISNLVKGCRIIFHAQEGYNIKTSRDNLHYFILDGIFFTKFLEKMGCMKGGEKVSYSSLGLPDNLCSFMEEMGYDQMQGAMFLLGYLVGEVGNAQYRRYSESGGDGTYKPVLNKINFNGIDKNKLIRLRSEILNKLRQEKILQYNEKIYAACVQLMDRNINNWKLNKDENLFYLLSGYAYATTAPMKKKGEENSDKQ